MKRILWACSRCLAGLCIATAPGNAEDPAEPGGAPPVRYEVRSPGVTLILSAEGRITGIRSGPDGLMRALEGETRLEGCSPVGRTVAEAVQGGGRQFTRTLAGSEPASKCRVVDRFTPTTDSIRWEVEILGDGAPWSTAILTRLAWPAGPQTRFWTAWSDPEQSDGWKDPLTPMPLKDASFYYGAPPYRTDNPRLGWCPFDPDIISLPLASFLEPESDTGLSLVLSPEDLSREIALRTTASGALAFARSRHRIDSRRPLKFSMDLVAHESGWRGSLRWMTARYPDYFEPAHPLAHELGGTGAYSCQDVDFDVEKMKRMAFRVNWRASFDFPYMGLFLPPVADEEAWTAFNGRKMSLSAMREYAAKMRRSGFYVLSYFNVAEFGAHVAWPLPARKALREADLWKDCQDYLGAELMSAVLRIPDRATTEVLAASIYPQSRPGGVYFTWEGGIVLDCGDPAYRDFLLEQAQRHLDKLPQASGICIDRMDWMRLYNERADDGESWFEGRPARSLMASWNGLMSRLGPLLHQAGKVVFVNNHYKRLDLMRHTDGIFDEFTYAGAALNLTALLTLRKPALGWTSNDGALKPDPDAFFQRYLHLGVYPMAPFPGNDHSIGPGEWVDRQYLDYGPLMDAMRGKQWVLAPRCVESSTGGAKVNLFEVPGGYALPVTFGGQAGSATVLLRGVPGLDRLRCEALHPGVEKAVAVPATRKGEVLALQVPLKRGCAMVLLRK